ncbi:hypothetical protein [Streptomyces sp. NBC_00385]|uniref:hypothetical protein n=1 Tax=Streptomyces sp. NBC_00385 TaxID=2975733 RepID=UPI002DD99A40|nr:hypothetical protein [Streptomyces sp. NBC_00385]WRZ02958.1 hypothetical protein OG959_06155 [Streptomyces sp. NBC_00385]
MAARPVPDADGTVEPIRSDRRGRAGAVARGATRPAERFTAQADPSQLIGYFP